MTDMHLAISGLTLTQHRYVNTPVSARNPEIPAILNLIKHLKDSDTRSEILLTHEIEERSLKQIGPQDAITLPLRCPLQLDGAISLFWRD
jgi:hypothetical protein